MTEKLTIRDQFALAALQGLLANTLYIGMFGFFKDSFSPDRDVAAEIYAHEAYSFADAMLEERK